MGNSLLSTQFFAMTENMLPEILIIENSSYPVGWSTQVFKDCLINKHTCQVLRFNEQIVGYYIVQKILDEYHILNLCVATDYLGQGLGRLLLNTILDKAQNDFMNRVLLEVRASNNIAKKLYKSSGFQIIGKRKGYYLLVDGKEDAHVMELALE